MLNNFALDAKLNAVITGAYESPWREGAVN